MSLPQYQKISSLSSLKSTIVTDYFVYHWFCYLIHQREVASRLKDIRGHLKFYDHFKGLSYLYNLSVCLLILTCLLFILTSYVYFGLISVIFMILAYFVSKREHMLIRSVVEDVFLLELSEEELQKMTLYQMTEIYSQKYQVPSFIGTLQFIDESCRKALLALLLFNLTVYVFLYQVPVWKFFLLMAWGYYSFRYFIISPFAYKRLHQRREDTLSV